MKLISPFVEYEHVVVGGAETVVALAFYAALWYMHMYPSAVAFGQRVWKGFGRPLQSSARRAHGPAVA